MDFTFESIGGLWIFLINLNNLSNFNVLISLTKILLFYLFHMSTFIALFYTKDSLTIMVSNYTL